MVTDKDMRDAVRVLAESIQRKIEQDLFGFSPQPPQAAVSADYILKDLERIQREMDAKDTLLQQGIKRDWVCIINTNTYYRLMNIARDLPPLLWGIERDINHVTGRYTHVIQGASDGLEYMTKELARARYPAFFAKLDADYLEMLGSLASDAPKALDDDIVTNSVESEDQ